MSIEFMVLSAPRSASAWVSNWLTTDTTLCLHEPLARWKLEELDAIDSPKVLGIACTALALQPDFVNAHPARKVILHRPLAEIRSSMKALRIEGDYDPKALDRIKGLHCDWREVFLAPEAIHAYLLEKPLDQERHRELLQFNVQNQRLIRELQHAH
jgi:hypothetical protein